MLQSTDIIDIWNLLSLCYLLFPLSFQEIPSEWQHELMIDRGIPVELWAHYVEQLHGAQRVAVEDSILLVFSLKNFIYALEAPKSFPKGKTHPVPLLTMVLCETDSWLFSCPLR